MFKERLLSSLNESESDDEFWWCKNKKDQKRF